MKKIQIIILTIQTVLIAAFLNFLWLADEAMGKDGIGNLELSQKYNNYTGIAFYLAVSLWVATIGMAIFGKCFEEKPFQLAIGLPPLLMVFGWASLLLA